MAGELRTELGREADIRRLAVMDWGNVPSSQIREELGIASVTLCMWRKEKVYHETAGELRHEFESEMLKLPSTSALRKKIQQGMALGVDAVIAILASKKTSNKDKIAAARLAAQMDGRFLRTSDEGEGASRDVDSMAQQLVNAIERHKGMVQ